MSQPQSTFSKPSKASKDVFVAIFGNPIQEFSFGPDIPKEEDVMKFWMSKVHKFRGGISSVKVPKEKKKVFSNAIGDDLRKHLIGCGQEVPNKHRVRAFVQDVIKKANLLSKNSRFFDEKTEQWDEDWIAIQQERFRKFVQFGKRVPRQSLLDDNLDAMSKNQVCKQLLYSTLHTGYRF